MKTRLSRIAAVIGVFVLSLSLLGTLAGHVQGGAPTATPTAAPSGQTPAVDAQNGTGPVSSNPDVTWTVQDQTFDSNYPAGFTFHATITSSAGPIVRGRVVWTHVPGTQRSRPADLDPDTGALTAVWEATGSDAVPPNLGVDYYWDISDADGNTYQTAVQHVEYEDPTHDWQRFEGDDVIVFTENLPSDLGPMVVDAMQQNQSKYMAGWGALLPYKPRAILFGDFDAWSEWQISYVNPRVIGTTRSDWGATVQVVSGSNMYDLAYGTVPHEVEHIYQDVFVGFLAVDWFNEGDATFFEISQQYDYEANVRQIAASGHLLPLLIDSGPGIRGTRARDGYDIGYTFWKWLTDTYGIDIHRQVMLGIRAGEGRNAALEQATGLSVQEIETQWRVWLGAGAEIPTLIPLPTAFTFPSPTPFGQ